MTKGTRRPHPLCKLRLPDIEQALWPFVSSRNIWSFENVRGGFSPKRGSRLAPALFRNANCAYRYILASVALSLKSDFARGGGEQRMIRAKANISTGVKFGSSLAYKNHAANNLLAAELLHAQTPTGRVAAVARGTACLFVSHNLCSEPCCGRPFKSPPTLTDLSRVRTRWEIVCSTYSLAEAAALPRAAPPARMSVTRTIVRSCLWPRLRFEFLRRRFLKA